MKLIITVRTVVMTVALVAVACGAGCTTFGRSDVDPEIGVPQPGESDPAAATRKALSKAVLPSVRFKDTAGTVIDYLNNHIWAVLPTGSRDVSFILLPDKQGRGRNLKSRFRLRNASVRDLIAELCKDIGYRFKIEKHAVIIVPPDRSVPRPEVGRPPVGKPDPAERVRKAMKSTVIYGQVCEYMTLGNIADNLGTRTLELDPDGIGVSFLLKPELLSRMNQVWLQHLPVEELLRYVCICADLQYRVLPQAVIIAPKGEASLPKLPAADEKSKRLLDAMVAVDEIDGPVSKAVAKLQTSLEGLKLKVDLVKPQQKLKSGEIFVEPDVELSLTGPKMPARQLLQYFAFASGLKITSIKDGTVTMAGKLVAVPAEDIADEPEAGEWEDE